MTTNPGCPIREVITFVASGDWSTYWAAMRIKLFLKPRTVLNCTCSCRSKLAWLRAGTYIKVQPNLNLINLI